ncbi:toll/interleukin-1 receptor domain-containing protein [Johnsonella ignava]|uniref:toll/interleukin-1 receptor domain-containing protein n=1 Tax=Johnsonella ignava TaxID=43995 RepID=UPI0023F1698B|nr:toll/interleukin-1 receptor domain-containing protein [Johnsonella ignava]
MSDNIIKKKEYKYDAFISYRHLDPDVDIAQKLHKLLETFKMPKELSKRIDWKSRSFIDREELTTGDLSSAIIEGLNNSRHLIVICSKRTKFSPWCIKEIETFRKIHGDDKVLALLVEGEPDEAFPDPVKQLKSRQKNEVIDAEYLNDTDDEPLSDTNAGEILAADVRPSKVKSPDFKGYEYLNREEIKELKKESLQILKQKEIYRIVAGMAGITYGDLKQRA